MTHVEGESETATVLDLQSPSCITTTPSLANSPQKPQTLKRNESHVRKQPSQPIGDDSGLLHQSESSLKDFWTFEAPENKMVTVSASLASRLRVQYSSREDNIDVFLRRYLFEQYMHSTYSSADFIQLLTVGSDFYTLSKAVCEVTHEFFVDGLNRSGVLPFFCSENPSDIFLGSSGRWEEVEKVIAGASGMPSFQSTTVRKVIEIFEKGIKTEKPYCRIVLLPFEKNGELDKKRDTAEFSGEILLIIPPHKLALHHQKDFFIAGEQLSIPWRPRGRMALVIWINEAYRVQYPPPTDVEECLVLWSLHSLDDVRVIDFDAVFRAFPDRNRSAQTKAEVLQNLKT